MENKQRFLYENNWSSFIAEIGNNSQLLTIFAKSSVIDFGQVPEYASVKFLHIAGYTKSDALNLDDFFCADEFLIRTIERFTHADQRHSDNTPSWH